MSVLRNTLKQDAFWKLNKVFVYYLGIEEAVILTMMIDSFFYYQEINKTVKKGGKEWFFYTSEKMNFYFKISYKVQKRILESLENSGYIFQKAFGVPCKIHFSIDEDKIYLLLNTSIPKMEDTVLPKGENWNLQNGNSFIKNIDNNNIDNSLSNDKDNFSKLQEKFAEHNPTAKGKKVAPKKGKKPYVMMRDSVEFNIEIIRFNLLGTTYAKANLEYYYEAALAWSDAKNKTSADWTATIRNFMLKDIKSNSLVTSVLSPDEKMKGMKDIIENWNDI